MINTVVHTNYEKLQYGKQWSEFVERKRRFDPDNILTPSQGIFSPTNRS
ncbi:hypothetical protein G7B40_036315 [Aetokthonos hydrillicola Thurmond2011]|uniref:Cytokinin dehydrogenase 1 FAD/cytokinin binding domain-containing protein n=1 Tax=Aetokthonos hydrillicola Thurmond2011 TaxID=2712845 RepID=A0AAP5IGB0_9CYAN|nr:hypothetical protein [Aetokthonos hydrillicola CCALA 1050]MBW4587411.1 hypothetical protein [Aetokthonos hydrillicola CCALA 1050]MDR9899979.1 hypothetical protein [Aetokthonos hydrillicola Thurmond2011]